MKLLPLLALSCVLSTASLTAFAAEPTGPAIASELRSRQAGGGTYARARLEGLKGAQSAVQVQIKSRGTGQQQQLVYQVLWPKERKGESVLWRKSGGSATGHAFTPPNETRTLGASNLRDSVFGSALTWEDVVDDPFAWSDQSVVGKEAVGRVECTILESKPNGSSSYQRVRTWVDTKRMVPMRIEKYGDGTKPLRTIETTRVVTDDRGQAVPAYLTVTSASGTTQVNGGKIQHGVSFADAEFTAEGLRETAIPRTAAAE